MTDPLVLSCFPGIGLLDMAFELEGFCVVRGPDLLWGGDVKRFHPPAGRFDGVIGGPPCQAFSRLRHLVKANGYATAENLIPEFERVVAKAQPAWFLMENVPDAPAPRVDGYQAAEVVLDNRQCDQGDGRGSEQSRRRRFSFGAADAALASSFRPRVVLWENPKSSQAVVASGGGRAVAVAPGGSGKLKRTHPKAGPPNSKSVRSFAEACRLQGLPEGFDLPPFTVMAKCRAVGNGVPLPMGRTIARAVREALGLPIVGAS